jgi:hypothetical protein
MSKLRKSSSPLYKKAILEFCGMSVALQLLNKKNMTFFVERGWVAALLR